MRKKFFITSENEETMRKALKELGISSRVVEELEYGYYLLDNGKISRISKLDYHMSEWPEFIYSGAACAIGAGYKISQSNKELNTDEYNEIGDDGEPSGHGHAFEDIVNRKSRKKGYKVDSSVDKRINPKTGLKYKGGPDAVYTDKDGNSFEVQYKCSRNAKTAARKIMARGGYPRQMLVVNTEIAEDLKKELLIMESEGKVPQGTANRVIDSGVTRDETMRMAQMGTKESLSFDSETALPTFIVAFALGGAVVLLYNVYKEKGVNKKVLKKTFLGGLACGTLCFLAHVVINQWKRKK